MRHKKVGGALRWGVWCLSHGCCCLRARSPHVHLPPALLWWLAGFLSQPRLALSHTHGTGALFSDALAWPSPVSASDGIVRDEGGRLLYHYAIINLAATLQAYCSCTVAVLQCTACRCGTAADDDDGRQAAAGERSVHSRASPCCNPVPQRRTPGRRRCRRTTLTALSGSPWASCAA